MHRMQNESVKKKFESSFPRQVAAVLIVAAVLSVYPLRMYASTEIVLAFVAGAMISLANAIAGYAAIEYSIGKSYTVFLKVVLGGMGVRMLVMLSLMLFLIEVVRVQAVPLVVSLLGFYTLFLILEVLFIQKKMSSKAEG